MASLAHQQKIDIGRVIQGGVSAVGANAPMYLLASLVLAGVPTFLVQYFFVTGVQSFSTTTVVLMVISIFVTLFGTYLLQAAMVRSSILVLSGRDADIGGSLGVALRLVLPMIGLAIVTTFGVALGMLLLIVPGIMLYVAWAVAVPVLIEEKRGVFGSLGRSAELTKGSRWAIFGLLVVYVIVAGVIGGVFGAFGPTNPFEASFAFALVNALSSTVTSLIAAAMLASLYVELRTAKEGATSDGLAAIFA